ncbi:MAG: phosphoribosylaminoimidazolesuccinocarboxamide synthase [Spirochaetes bacterium]|jgi:fusion protein PurCD|nr:phosphoribosylaminoimidazolesuccinocarboxamide synthase [Spirochaetota bacterium]
MRCLDTFSTPQLELIHKGKVRDSYRIDSKRRMIVVTDRISAFDNVLNNYIPYKGSVLNGISNFWFSRTTDIIDNHILEVIDPNMNIVKEAEPIRVEVIVRGYLTGSMWRGYENGKRTFSGVTVGEGLTYNQRFETPLVTPTTKEDSDREISPEDIAKEGWVAADVYKKMADIALQLFERGSTLLAEKGIVLVDTKYEFGMYDGKLILIDEIHTPDSSRFWRMEDYKKDPSSAEQIDKEFVRQWLIKNSKEGRYPDTLDESVVEETSRRYVEIYEIITDEKFNYRDYHDSKHRVSQNLTRAGLIKDGYVAIVMGSPSDKPHADKMKSIIEEYGIHCFYRVISAHKNGERLVELAEQLNNSVEPGAVIAVAGRSNGLGGALGANLSVPVISCPPFKDSADILVNVNSSLMMPSKTPASTVVYPDNAALNALRSLNITRVRKQMTSEIAEMKLSLVDADKTING